MQFSETFNEPSENHFMETSSLKEDSFIFENFNTRLYEMLKAIDALSFLKLDERLENYLKEKYSEKEIDLKYVNYKDYLKLNESNDEENTIAVISIFTNISLFYHTKIFVTQMKLF